MPWHKNGLMAAERGQRFSARLPVPLRPLALRYSHWNWGWRADIGLRYVPVDAALRRAGYLQPGTAAWSLQTPALILDVGCGSKGGVTSYVPVRTVGLDVEFNVERIRRHGRVAPMVGSGLAIPARQSTFDVVLCMDTLEHLSPAQRNEMLRELFRVVRVGGLVIVGTPCGAKARAAEMSINAEYRARTGEDHPWLAEHLANDPLTPDGLRDLVASAAAKRFRRFDLDLFPNTNLNLWIRLQREGILSHVHRLVYRPIWPLLRKRHEPPVYRYVCVVRNVAL